ncbi:hypothetical protein D3C78_1307350 [compost metagenome]
MKINIVIADDWEGLYLNNRLIEEGHKIKRLELVGVMKEFNTFDVEEQWLNNAGIEAVERIGSLPSKYDDIARYITQ